MGNSLLNDPLAIAEVSILAASADKGSVVANDGNQRKLRQPSSTPVRQVLESPPREGSTSVVFLLAHSRLLPEALAQILSRKNDTSVVGSCALGPSSLDDEIVAARPEVLVVDLSTDNLGAPRAASPIWNCPVGHCDPTLLVDQESEHRLRERTHVLCKRNRRSFERGDSFRRSFEVET